MQGFPLPRTAEIDIVANGRTYLLLRKIDTNLWETLHRECPRCGHSLVSRYADRYVCACCVKHEIALLMSLFRPIRRAA